MLDLKRKQTDVCLFSINIPNWKTEICMYELKLFHIRYASSVCVKDIQHFLSKVILYSNNYQNHWRKIKITFLCKNDTNSRCGALLISICHETKINNVTVSYKTDFSVKYWSKIMSFSLNILSQKNMIDL